MEELNNMLGALKDGIEETVVSAANLLKEVVNNPEGVTTIGSWFSESGNLLVMMSIILAAIIFIIVYASKRINPVSPFIYSNARIQARTTQLLTNQKQNDLSESKTIRDFGNQLKDTEYSTYIEELGADKENLTALHNVLEKSFTKSVDELEKLSPKTAKPLFKAYSMFSESRILKTIYRAKSLKKKLDEKLLFAVGNINEVTLRHLIDAETIADMGVVLNNSVYHEIFSKKYDTIEEFEVALDTFILNKFIYVANNTKMFDANYIIDIVNKKVDILNIIALLKFRIRGMEKTEQKKLLINNNTTLTSRFKKLIDAKDLEEFVEVTKNLSYHDPLTKALEHHKKTDSFMLFETELYKFYKEFVVGADLYHTLGPYPLFSYLTKKQFELQNLFIISKGVEAKLGSEKIRGMII